VKLKLKEMNPILKALLKFKLHKTIQKLYCAKCVHILRMKKT